MRPFIFCLLVLPLSACGTYRSSIGPFRTFEVRPTAPPSDRDRETERLRARVSQLETEAANLVGERDRALEALRKNEAYFEATIKKALDRSGPNLETVFDACDDLESIDTDDDTVPEACKIIWDRSREDIRAGQLEAVSYYKTHLARKK